jgi:hypothetical protein
VIGFTKYEPEYSDNREQDDEQSAKLFTQPTTDATIGTNKESMQSFLL